ncbi:hypothetical protein [Paludibaculum fermentans]|uniref:hypothetical protein n=1 Tax=Paludibaculum fermentans TaxID=1473598 RepID=UPI003EB9B1FF
MARLDRGLTDAAFRLWIEKEVPTTLLGPILTCIPNDPCALDVQLRKGGVLQVYHGNTSLLRIKTGKSGELLQLDFGSYESEVAKLDSKLRGRWRIDEAEDLSRQLCRVLPTLAACVGRSYYQNRKEGFWENQLAYTHGRGWRADKEWLVIDRQAVVGFDSGAELNDTVGPIVGRHAAALESLIDRQPRRWAKPKAVGNELDLLAVNHRGEILCIELKHASNSEGVYCGPFQAAVYRDTFHAVAESIVPDLDRLVRQKVVLGLLPPMALGLMPFVKLPVVRGVLAVVGNQSREVQRRLRLCLDSCEYVEYWQLDD